VLVVATIPAEALDLLRAPRIGIIATLLADGAVQATPVWVGHEDGMPTFNTADGRVKVRNIARDPRITLTVFDRDEPERYLQVRGTAEVSAAGAIEHVEALAREYTGRPFRALAAGESRLVVGIHPLRVDYHTPED
jgi:PPOX class probable F420-dependent enzyme